MEFPTKRMRRLRKSPQIRDILRETRLHSSDIIYPIFVSEKLEGGEPESIDTMPGQYRYSVDDAVSEASRLEDEGLSAVLLFGMPSTKDEFASSAYDPDGAVQRTVRRLKEETELVVMTDVCLCQYTTHGHCGIVVDGEVVNDETLDVLARIALSHAEAGADVVAPSDMMDGRVAAIRRALDDAGFSDTLIMSYAVKYASAFYAPFRDAVSSAPAFGDRRSYQMDPANVSEALMEAELDLKEGADILMVKPALAYLDVIEAVKDRFRVPLAAYNVSGEYSMLRAAIDSGYLTEEAIYESILSIKRAGADLIISHFAPELLGVI
ncbi:porphobilinogen synthase [Methanothermobacter marburgensis]|uniref:Delta-aminolevulinic acid dehydratase n=1 Tax=Methanothermobacter marburgensis (strain ATCC BAA-927 / DSM 2133 / JCM 14651 / NBRC 100331 / OCM 82 / Marburg) TaxID=79929 RepID=D9PWY5_METTM|nr:porphobilinogen synthase [Methanothermobacter marburgensis]ADL58733.1 delta-aminolevulinic acid dehydratase [Methanothermobacter marburgensis str. Marburg]WBF09298.1 porphobilinogen synthase [Methanothermobacter marburgensis]